MSLGLCLALGACLALAACGPSRKDSLSPDVCRDANAPFPDASLAELSDPARRARQVVRGRVRWTGSVTDVDGDSERELAYVIVDILEFHRGDAWSVDPKMVRSFPLLGDEPAIRALGCRTGEAFFFFVDLPGASGSAETWPGGTPDPIFRSFGPRAVTLRAIAPETSMQTVRAALALPP